MEYLTRLKQLIVRPEFFTTHQFLFRSGVKFYAMLLLIFIAAKVVLALPAVVTFFQTVFSEEWHKQQSIITELYPAELVLTVNDGVISTNVSEPYAIALPGEWQEQNYQETAKNLIVIDTTKPIDTGDFAAKDTILILSKYGFGYHDPAKGEFRIYDLRDKNWHENFTLTQSIFSEFVTKVGSMIKWLLFAGCAILPFFLYALFFVLYLIYLLFGAMIVWLGAKLRGHQLTYGQAYSAGFYLLPVPFLYEFISSFVFTEPNSGIPFAFTLILLVMTLVNFPKKPATPAIASETSTVTAVDTPVASVASIENQSETK